MFSRLGEGDRNAVFIVQRVVDDTRLWLSVHHPVSGKTLEKHFIYPFEVWMLLMDPIETYRASWHQAVAPRDPDSVAFSIMRILEDRLSWDELATLTNTIIHPTFTKSDTAWDDLEQIIPQSIQGDFRHELKAFLVWVLKEPELQNDPIEFFFRLTPLRYFKSLLEVRYRFLVQAASIPSYLQIIRAESSASGTERATSETLHERAFTRFLYDIMAKSPDLRSTAIRHCQMLNRTGNITLRLPVTKEQASKSKEKWMERFVLFTLGLHLRTHVRPQAFGLRRVLYFGNAYRWPHPHLSWSVGLGISSIYPVRLQMLFMPASALEQAKRYLPSLAEVDWSARAFNPSIFSRSRNEWNPTHQRILAGLQEEVDLRSLISKYGRWRSRNLHRMSLEEAKVLDSTSARLNLAFLETEKGRKHWGVNEESAIAFLSRMRKQDAIQVFYEIKEAKLPRPLIITTQGEQDKNQCIVRAFLANSPSAEAYVGCDWGHATIISSLNESSRNALYKSLPEWGAENNIEVKCHVPESFQNYSHDVFQRLLKDDWAWVDDISGLVTQGRSNLRRERPLEMRFDSRLFDSKGAYRFER